MEVPIAQESSPQPNRRLSYLQAFFTVAAVFLLISTFGLAQAANYYNERIWPNTTIDGIKVGGLTKEEATKLLEELDIAPTNYTTIIRVDDIVIKGTEANLRLDRNIHQAVDKAFVSGKTEAPIERLSLFLVRPWQPQAFTTELQYVDEDLSVLMEELKSKVDIEGAEPSATLGWSSSPNTLVIDPGKPGRSLDLEATRQAALASLAQVARGSDPTAWETEAIVASTSSPLSPEGVTAARQRTLKFVNSTIVFQADNQRVALTDQNLVSLLTFPSGMNENHLDELISEWAETVDRPPINAAFEYDPKTLAVTLFEPHRDGLRLNQALTAMQIRQLVADLEKEKPVETSQKLAVETAAPDITLADTNDLGITERVGFGESWYQGSIASRTHNIAVATKKLNHTIIRPGEEYSFNKNLGEVSARTGFQQAYIIKGGATILGDGGGVCQVSSTLFRALLDSGVDITRRLPHSYRVSYYEQRSEPGFDATVYSGNVDLRFINDTGNHLIMHTYADSVSQYMYIEFYGTSDGRTTEISDYLKWDARPAPPTQYIPDPSLAPGQTRRIETAVPGLKTKFTHRVLDRNGELMRENTYYSSYIPWAAKFLVGPEN
jgi:vancomycin resistance protein YoaR